MTEIKWAYDASNQSFSPLPASPFLLPALGLICLFPILEKIIDETRKNPRPCNVDQKEYNKYKTRYYYLIEKEIACDGLNENEKLELYDIMHPPWAESGELWTY